MVKTIYSDEIKQLEEELRMTRGMLDALTNNPAIAFVICDLEDNVQYTNQTFEGMFGWPRGEVLRARIPIIPDRFARLYKDTLVKHNWQAGTYETFRRRKDGSEFAASESIYPILDGQGKVQSYVCVIRDITARKQEERRLKESEQRYKSMFEHNPDAVFSFDLQGICTSANPAVQRITGYSAEELCFRSMRDVIFIERGDEVRALFEAAKQGITQNFESAIIHKDGNRVELSVVMLLLDLNGFKHINDSFGHSAGDYVLRISADRLKKIIGEDGLAARMGGDEFTVLLKYSGEESVTELANRLSDKLSEPIAYSQAELTVSASIGIAYYPDQGDTLDMLLRNADMAMYRVKEFGKNKCYPYSGT